MKYGSPVLTADGRRHAPGAVCDRTVCKYPVQVGSGSVLEEFSPTVHAKDHDMLIYVPFSAGSFVRSSDWHRSGSVEEHQQRHDS